ncbi:hypothetical protein RRG08_067213 [Elysia crispata]|uniref:Integrase catalytic domain-containing protein n=1 Tax=Elysia crispata TaxID=231223 RepID=A0AAE0XT39_9GAST|nr:hypothetical protein RRG08_067213 [Elysia crispata]
MTREPLPAFSAESLDLTLGPRIGAYRPTERDESCQGSGRARGTLSHGTRYSTGSKISSRHQQLLDHFKHGRLQALKTRDHEDNPVKIPTNPVYSHTATGGTPVYYRSQCSVSLSVQQLGEGTHRFLGYIYPDVTGGSAKVTGKRADKTVTLRRNIHLGHVCMHEVCEIADYTVKATTPYHPMCNGLVEKFNGTLKKMLKRLCNEKPKQWHRYINALLFAYRRSPQDSTHFAPIKAYV